MKPIFRATAMLGSSSAISAAVGLVSAKLWALLIGPEGIGYLAMQQSLLALAAMLGGLGVGTGIVRLGARAIAEEDLVGIAAFRRAAILIAIVSGCVGAALLLAFGDVINSAVFDGRSSGREVGSLGIALTFTLLTSAFTGILNAYHNVRALATVAVLNSVSSAAIMITFVWRLGTPGIVPGLILVAIANCFVSYLIYRSQVDAVRTRITGGEGLLRCVKSLLRFGVPFTASMIVGMGVQLVMPILVLNELGLESTGYYRAATNIAVASLGIVMTAMGQDYYPRLSAASENDEFIISTVNQQIYLLFVLLAPVILWLLFLAPYVVPILYTSNFLPAANILNWFLVGDIFRLLSWSMAFVILARSRSWVYFLIELFGGITSLTAAVVFMRLLGIGGIGIGYLATLFLYYLLVLMILRRKLRMRFRRENKLWVAFTVAAALVISILTSLEWWPLRTAAGTVICLSVTAASIFTVITRFWRTEKADPMMGTPGEEPGK